MHEVDYLICERKPCIRIEDEVITDTNDSFAALTGYSREELLGGNIFRLLNDILKLSRPIDDFNQIDINEDYFFFTKVKDFKDIAIRVIDKEKSNVKYIVFSQVPVIGVDNAFSYTYQLISDNIVGIALYSAKNNALIKASKEYERIIYSRYHHTDIVGKKIDEIYVDWINHPERVHWETVINTKKSLENRELSCMNLITGEQQYFDSSITPIIDKGEVKFLVVSLSDVTDKVNFRKENERKNLQIQQQQELLEAVIEKQSDSIFIIDKEENVIIVNKAGKERYKNKSMKTVTDIQNAAEFFDESGIRLEAHELPVRRVVRGEKIENLTIKIKLDEEHRYLSMNGTPLYKEDGTYDYAFLSGADITELIESRQKLASQKNQLEYILDNMTDAIFISDKDDKYIYKNKASRDYFGVDIKNIGDAHKAAKFYELDGTEIGYEDMPEYNIMNGEPVNNRVLYLESPIKKAYVSVSTTPIFDDKGNFIMGLLASRDVSEQINHSKTIKEQQQALLIAEKRERENLENVIAMKDEFISLISHEFKTPLTVINSALQAMELLCKKDITEKLKTYLDKIRQNTYRQMRLVNNLLDVTRANAERIKVNNENVDIVYITDSIIESVKLYASQKEIVIDFKSDVVHKIIAMDEEKYERILLNLLSNAIKFSPRNSKIIVKLKLENGKVLVCVTDQGMGIPKEKQEYIFERFGQLEDTYTRQAEGTGIGLYLVKLMVDEMRGQVHCQSKLGEGSTFTVQLPDELTSEAKPEVMREFVDERLITSIAIEFSDIYF